MKTDFNSKKTFEHYKLLLALILIVLAEIPNYRYVNSDSQSSLVSGSFVSSFPSQYGNSEFTVIYSFAKNLKWNSNFSINCLVEINDLTGLKEYVLSYALVTTIYGSNGVAIMGSTLGGYPNSLNYLYSGSHWGPLSVTTQINRTAFSNPGAETFSASVSLEFIAQVQYANSINGVGLVDSETNASNLGTINIIAAGSIPVIYYYLAGTIIAVIVVISLLELRHLSLRRKTLPKDMLY